MEKIAVIGTGYVGLVTGTCLADLGNTVTCLDVDQNKIDQLNAGEIPLYEPNLKAYLTKNSTEKRLFFSTDMTQALISHDIIMICVGTPTTSDGTADTSAYFAVLDQIAHFIVSHRPLSQKLIINKSTLPIGTAQKAEAYLLDKKVFLSEFSILSNPEFLREGAAIHDFFHPDRIIVGSTDTLAIKRMKRIYKSLYRSRNPIIITSPSAAELIKYTANAFLAMKLSFVNEIAALCDALKIDVQEVMNGIGSDNRISPYFLHPGPGYGGSCFPKDTRALSAIAKQHNTPLRLVDTTIAVNDAQLGVVFKKIQDCLGDLKHKHIGVLGLSFKPDTDDIRESPAIALIQRLCEAGATVCAYDPEAMETAKAVLGDTIMYGKHAYHAANDANLVVLMTEWHAFRLLDVARLAQIVREKYFVDARNVYDKDLFQTHGFKYLAIGRANTVDNHESIVDLDGIEYSYGGTSDF